MSLFSSDSWRQSLIDLHAVAPYRYAQWLYEDKKTLEYRVAASAGGDSYVVAHRTGIIGQVFRTGAPVFVRDVRSHILYDPFDPSVVWEWAAPFTALDGTRLVVNLEGQEQWADSDHLLRRLPDFFRELPLRGFPSSIPEETPILRANPTTMLRACEALAYAGQWVAAIGFFPEHAPADHLTYQEALKNNLPLAECIFPCRPRLDLFLLSDQPVPDLTPALRLLGSGRYHAIITQGQAIVVPPKGSLLGDRGDSGKE
jgi:hypothetical protein